MRRRTANNMALRCEPEEIYFKPEATATCVVSSCETLGLLAAGTTPAPGVSPSLSFLLTGSEGLFTAVDCFSSPSPFASICWSPPSANTREDGLIAGGLYNGCVAIWELDALSLSLDRPKEVLPRVNVLKEHFGTLTQRGNHAVHLPGDDRRLREDDWVYDDGGIMWRESQTFVAENQAWEPRCMTRVRDNKAGKVSPSTTGMVGYFGDSRFSAPVRGISFCSPEPHMLVSGAGGRLVLWDMNQVGSSSVNSWESVDSSMSISGVAWSSRDKNVLGYGFQQGMAALLDVRTKIPVARVITKSARSLSSIAFSPHSDNVVAVSCDDASSDHAVTIWDTRMLGVREPIALRHLCESSGGVRCLSWNTKQDLILVGTRTEVQIWDDKEIVCRERTGLCIDVAWSHMDDDRFVASLENKLTMYKL